MKAPVLDKRTREQILAQALTLAGVHLPDADLAGVDLSGWPGYVPDWAAAAGSTDPGVRLAELFARLAELLIDRLNGVPEANFLSFLEFTGVERFPGAPAEAPVTFLVSKRSPLGGIVPAGTQVATTQTEKADARVFETRRSFFATPARLESIVAVHPGAERYVDIPVPQIPPTATALETLEPTQVLTDAEPALRDVAHVLYLGSEALFGRKDAADVSITIDVAAGAFPDAADIVWRRFDKAAGGWVDLAPPTAAVTATDVTITFTGLSDVGKTVIDGVEDFWLAAHFTGTFDEAATPVMVAQATGTVAPPTEPLTQLDAAFHNTEPIDLSKPFFPFGRRPAYADAFYFASEVAFGPDVQSVTIAFRIRPYSTGNIATMYTGVPDTTVVTRAAWQFLDVDGRWQELAVVEHRFNITTTASGTTVTSEWVPPTGENAAAATFIHGSPQAAVASVTRSGFEDRIGNLPVHGVMGHWMRVLLLSEHPYGNDGVLVDVITPDGITPRFIGPLFLPPVIEKVEHITYVPGTTAAPITNVKTLNGFAFSSHPAGSGAFEPYRSVARRELAGAPVYGPSPALYLAFDRPFPTGAFISLFFALAERDSQLSSPLESGNPNIAWEYWSEAGGWTGLHVVDDTLNLTTSGTAAFVAPGDAATLALFPQFEPTSVSTTTARWWLRARLASGRFDQAPALIGIYPNTTIAANRSTVAELLVGSSNGEPNQSFALVRAPVLGGDLWVRETERPTEQELRELEQEHATDRVIALTPAAPTPVVDIRSVAGEEPEIWVRWRRTPNFRLSGPRSRHYAMDGVAAVVGFGTGTRGLIPPVGRNNIVFRDFQTGGGSAANLDAVPLAVKELKTSLSFIERVFNVQAAAAGASPWSIAQLGEFGPQMLKNRGRPVTIEDYEWMVRQRFSSVARVRCLPVRAPGPGGTLVFKAGGVTLVIVPWSSEPRPQPDQGLTRSVREFLAQTALTNIAADIHVKGPDYVAIDVEATLVATSPELVSVLVRQARAALDTFLHPLTGGEDGAGYGFGRAVFISEVQAVLERLDGVDHVLSAQFAAASGAEAFPVTGDRLASSGAHRITVVAI